MHVSIAEAQGDVRRLYAGGFYGQLVSGAVWLVAAAVATSVSPPAAVATLFFGLRLRRDRGVDDGLPRRHGRPPDCGRTCPHDHFRSGRRRRGAVAALRGPALSDGTSASEVVVASSYSRGARAHDLRPRHQPLPRAAPGVLATLRRQGLELRRRGRGRSLVALRRRLGAGDRVDVRGRPPRAGGAATDRLGGSAGHRFDRGPERQWSLRRGAPSADVRSAAGLLGDTDDGGLAASNSQDLWIGVSRDLLIT